MGSSEAKAKEQDTVKKKKIEGVFGCVRVVYNFIANKVLVRVVRSKIMQRMRSSIGNGGGGTEQYEGGECDVDEESSRLAISTFRAREEEIERRKTEVKGKVELQLGRAEEETRRLAHIWEVMKP